MLKRRTARTALVLTLGGLIGVLAGQQGQAQTTPDPTVTTPPTTTTPQPMDRQVTVTARIRSTQQGALYLGRGRFTGRPFTSGRMETRARQVSSERVRVQITLFTRVGRVFLTASTSGVPLRGRAQVTRGTGAYRGIKGTDLTISFASGDPSTTRLRGKVRYAGS